MARRTRAMAAWPAAVFNPWGAWLGLAAKTGEMLTASQQVIAARTTRMAHAGARPTQADRREMGLMVGEKLDAFSRSAMHFATAWGPTWQLLATQAARAWMGMAMSLWRAAPQALGAALAPVHRTATANARRLGPRRTRRRA